MSSMEENKNMADDLADGAKTAAQDAKTLAKAGANLAAGNIAGAVKEVAKNPPSIRNANSTLMPLSNGRMQCAKRSGIFGRHTRNS